MDPRHEKFCQHYLVSFNATDAARQAGYSEKSCASLGYQLLRRPDVQQFLAEARARAAASADLELTDVLRELKRIAFANPRDVMDWGTRKVPLGEGGVEVDMPYADPKDSATLHPDVAAAVAEVSVGKQGVKIKMQDKVAALDKLMRHLGGYERDNSQVADGLAALIAGAQGSALPLGQKDKTP